MTANTPQEPPIYRDDILDLARRTAQQARFSLEQTKRLHQIYAVSVPGLDSLTTAVESLIGGLEALMILIAAEGRTQGGQQ